MLLFFGAHVPHVSNLVPFQPTGTVEPIVTVVLNLKNLVSSTRIVPGLSQHIYSSADTRHDSAGQLNRYIDVEGIPNNWGVTRPSPY
jgi:hypothetical protein